MVPDAETANSMNPRVPEESASFDGLEYVRTSTPLCGFIVLHLALDRDRPGATGSFDRTGLFRRGTVYNSSIDSASGAKSASFFGRGPCMGDFSSCWSGFLHD